MSKHWRYSQDSCKNRHAFQLMWCKWAILWYHQVSRVLSLVHYCPRQGTRFSLANLSSWVSTQLPDIKIVSSLLCYVQTKLCQWVGHADTWKQKLLFLIPMLRLLLRWKILLLSSCNMHRLYNSVRSGTDNRSSEGCWRSIHSCPCLITICHSIYFSGQSLQQHKHSHNVSNYLWAFCKSARLL